MTSLQIASSTSDLKRGRRIILPKKRICLSSKNTFLWNPWFAHGLTILKFQTLISYTAECSSSTKDAKKANLLLFKHTRLNKRDPKKETWKENGRHENWKETDLSTLYVTHIYVNSSINSYYAFEVKQLFWKGWSMSFQRPVRKQLR